MVVFKAIYSLVALVLFFAMMPLMLVLYLLLYPFDDKTRMLGVLRINRIFLGAWRAICGITIKVEGLEKKKDDQVYVFVLNHNNLIDIPACGSLIPHYFKPLSKKEIVRIPLLGWLFGMTSILVDRSNPESRKKSVGTMVDALKKGISIMIFPEGTRNRTPNPLKEFHEGAFKIAIAAQVPIMPILQLDYRLLQKVDTFWVQPGKARFVYLDPIPTAGLIDADVPALKQQVFDLMYQYIQREDRYFSQKK